MKKIKWQRLLAFICLTLVISTVSSLFIGFYQAAAAASIRITFGSNGNWQTYFSAYADAAYVTQGGSTTKFQSKETADGATEGSCDPQIKLYKGGMNYKRATNDIIQVKLQIASFTDKTANPGSIKFYLGNTTSDIKEANAVALKNVDWSNVGEESSNYQVVEAVIPSTLSTINVMRIDMPDGGTYTQCVFRLVDIYMGPRSGAPYTNANRRVTYSYKNASNTTVTSSELVANGQKPVSVPTVSTVTSGTTQYAAKNTWTTGSTTGITAATIKNTAVTADITYTAEYTTKYKVTFNYKAQDNTATSKSVWIAHNATPGNNVPTPPTNPQTSGTTHTRQRFLGTWGGVATATVKTTKITGAKTYNADYITQWQILYSNYRESYDGGQVTTEEWVDNGQKPTKYKGKDTYVRNAAGDSQHIIVKIVRETTSNGTTNKEEYTENFDDAYDFVADRNVVYRFTYNAQYLVRYYKANNTTVLNSQWVTNTKKPTKPTAEAVSGKTFVAWLKNSTSGTAVEPTTTAISAPTKYYPRYLSNAFVGSSTNSIVVDRTVTLKEGTTNATHQYTIRLDIYNYGKVLDGYIKIMDNLKEDFAVITDRKVYRVPYLGNGKFADDGLTRAQFMEKTEAVGDADPEFASLGNSGKHAYVDDLRVNDEKTRAYIWLEAKHSGSGDIDHHYYCMHLYQEGYADNYGDVTGGTDRVVRNSDTYKKQAYLRETATGASAAPYGYKLVMFFDIDIERDGTIGGNNLPLSHATEHSKVEYYSSLTATSPATTIQLSDVHAKKGEAWPNANVEILYDFCPHDYYMDLYDVEKTHVVSSGKMKAEKTFVQPGIITVLRRQASGTKADHEANNYIIYGGMFTHGNGPVYVRKSENVNEYNKLGLPNTDCNGVRNEKVTITYSVKHNQMGKVVYETKCMPYEHNFLSTNMHGEVVVDFMKDHSVTITATVTPVSNADDSFGRSAVATTWQNSVQSYYFAPRIAVMDTSNNIPIPLQNEAAAASNFVAQPSFEYGTRAVAEDRVFNIENPAVESNKYLYWCFRKDTANGYTYNMGDQNAQILRGIQTITYTAQAVNTPKRFTSADTMENRDKVVRHAYYIPSTCITYDQNALSFDNIANWKLDGRVSQAFQNYYVNKTDAPTGDDRYGFDSAWHKELRSSTYADRKGNGKDYNGGVRYTNVDATARNEWGIFTFTGTGFDLYSRNGPDTGIIVAQVYEGVLTTEQLKDKTPVQNILADTYLDEVTYYQVPSIQWRAEDASGNLKHGTYTVRFRAYYHEAFDHELYKSGGKKAPMTEAKVLDIMGWDDSVPCSIKLSDAAYPALTRAATTGNYDVYIDGIRVYNTLGNNLTQATGDVLSGDKNALRYAAYAIYNRDKEVNAKYFNVNETLVDAEDQPAWNGGEANGVFYVAANGGSDSRPNDQYVGYYIGMEGNVYMESVDYTDSQGRQYVKHYFLDAKGNRIADKETGKYIFQYSKDNKYYLETTPWTVLTPNELNHALDNRIAFYGDKYDAVGPEFEIYLTQGNGVAFNVSKSGAAVTAVHVSLRCSNTGLSNQVPVDAEVYDASKKAWVDIPVSYKSDFHEQYYDVTKYANANGGNVYIRNNGANSYLSVMNVKVVGGTPPTANTRMMVEAIELIRGEAETPVVDEGLNLKHSLNLESDISVNYVVPAAALEGMQSSYLSVELPQYRGNELVGTETVTVNGTLKGEMYYYTLSGLTAVQMNDELKATLHVVKNGEHFISETDHYSIAAYAFAQLNKEDAPQSLKALCANLLRYGGAAQTFKGYRTDFLADEELRQDHRAYLTDLETVSFGTTNAVLEDLEAPSVLWRGKALDLNSKVAVKFIVDPTNYEGEAEKLSLRISYLNGKGEEETVTLTRSELYAEGEPYRAFVFDGLLAAELRTVLSAAVYDGDTRVSATLQYAADAYGMGKTGDLGTLCKALFAYVDTAEAFFAN
ncbi:MAG: hypothetical protein J6K89_03300 [Oscillospiraceae bacterium]|nr:hypothetical protein [Oscillospiraceae bacterium]